MKTEVSDYCTFTCENLHYLLSSNVSVSVSYTHLDVYKRQGFECYERVTGWNERVETEGMEKAEEEQKHTNL